MDPSQARPGNTPPGDTDMTYCDREPIHRLGLIQSFGFLLSANDSWLVVRASENAPRFLGQPAEAIVGERLEAFLPQSVLHDARGRLQMAGGPFIVERLFAQRIIGSDVPFDIAIHQSGHEYVLEFEPSVREQDVSLTRLHAMFRRIEQHRAEKNLCHEAARQVRAMTGFDRVMVYRFAESGAGEVIAESLKGGLPPFLGLHYPATDIPVQARALYERNILRIIVDVGAEPVPVWPVLSPEGEPLDLSMSVLRGVSPVHLEYLRNMGVRCSMSISILRDGRLWGLIACHHGQPRHLPLATRATAELFGQMFSYLLEVRHQAEQAAHDLNIRAVHHRIASSFTAPGVTLATIGEMLQGLQDHIPADGIATFQGDEINLYGLTPTREEFAEIVKFLNRTSFGRVYATDHLGEAFPPAADYPMRAAGLLSIPVSRLPRDYVVLFRREAERSVVWAGPPAKTAEVGPHGVRLSPRKSFDAWRETMTGRSKAWNPRDIRTAEALRLTLVELVLQLADAARMEREEARKEARERQSLLIGELNHRVRNILGLVRGLLTQSAPHAATPAELVENLGERLRSLSRSFELLAETEWREASLHALLRAEIAPYEQASRQLVLVGPDVTLQPKGFAAMTLVIHEIVTNALKYGALSVPDGQAVVRTGLDPAGNVTIEWREVGGPPVTPPKRRGFGSTILKQVIPFDLNGTSTPHYHPEGFVLRVVVPAPHATCVGARDAIPSAAKPANEVDTALIQQAAGRMLVVEDNLFIALDAEDMLRGLGVRTIDIAKSVREALEMLEANAYGCALVDVNLGQEISLPVARRLRERGIPFLFGTGYGDHKSMDESLKDIAIVSKPYHEKAMGLALTRLLRQQPGRGGGGQGDGGQGDSGQADSGQGEAGQTPPNA